MTEFIQEEADTCIDPWSHEVELYLSLKSRQFQFQAIEMRYDIQYSLENDISLMY